VIVAEVTNIYDYYPTVLVIVQKARETSTNIARYCYCTVGYCKVPCARSSCYSCSFLSSYWKRLEKVKLENKSLIRCFGVRYRRIIVLVVCILTRPAVSSKYSTTHKNILRYFTPKHLIRYIYRVVLLFHDAGQKGFFFRPDSDCFHERAQFWSEDQQVKHQQADFDH